VSSTEGTSLRRSGRRTASPPVVVVGRSYRPWPSTRAHVAVVASVSPRVAVVASASPLVAAVAPRVWRRRVRGRGGDWGSWVGNERGDEDGWVDLGDLSFRMVFELFSNGFRDWPREKRARGRIFGCGAQVVFGIGARLFWVGIFRITILGFCCLK